jgi:hypothetical protein
MLEFIEDLDSFKMLALHNVIAMMLQLHYLASYICDVSQCTILVELTECLTIVLEPPCYFSPTILLKQFH